MTSKVVIVDPHQVIKNNIEAIERHKIYSKFLKIYSKSKLDLIVLSPQNNIKFKPLKILFFVFELKNYVQNNRMKISLLVCGDPWIPYWITLGATKLAGVKIPIQVQLHGDFGNIAWRNYSFRNKIKYHFIKFDEHKVQSLRFVSKSQFKNLKDKIPKVCKVLIVPVPLSINLDLESINLNKTLSPYFRLLFVGRLEPDRGLENLYKILNQVDYSGTPFKLAVVGHGFKQSELFWLSKYKFKHVEFTFHGFLTGSKLIKQYLYSDLALCLANSESYGRVARESLVCGTPVLGIPSSGLIELNNFVKGQGITISQEILKPNKFKKIALLASKKTIDKEIKLKLVKSNQININLLLNSWIEFSRA
jgi:glycosyltransferase involved in cell wall biosynthesis